MTKPWIFMGVDRSHFSAKLRPALRYKQLHYVEYPPDMRTIQKRTGTGFVPVLLTPDDEILQDTTDIIDYLDVNQIGAGVIPKHPQDECVCRMFELYADEFFPMVSMRTRWAYPENEQELRRAFASFSGSLELGNKTADLMSSYLPALGIHADTIPAIDAHTQAVLAAFDQHLAQYPFLLGNRLTLADCALMGPLYAHLYLDRVTRKMLYDNYLNVCMCIERCNRPVPDSMGETFSGEYPASLYAVLQLLGADAAPVLLAQYQAAAKWLEQQDLGGQALPRGAGPYTSSLRGVTVQAETRSYVVWKIQRCQSSAKKMLDVLGEAGETWLTGIGWRQLAFAEGAPEIAKQNFALVLA